MTSWLKNTLSRKSPLQQDIQRWKSEPGLCVAQSGSSSETVTSRQSKILRNKLIHTSWQRMKKWSAVWKNKEHYPVSSSPDIDAESNALALEVKPFSSADIEKNGSLNVVCNGSCPDLLTKSDGEARETVNVETNIADAGTRKSIADVDLSADENNQQLLCGDRDNNVLPLEIGNINNCHGKVMNSKVNYEKPSFKSFTNVSKYIETVCEMEEISEQKQLERMNVSKYNETVCEMEEISEQTQLEGMTISKYNETIYEMEEISEQKQLERMNISKYNETVGEVEEISEQKQMERMNDTADESLIVLEAQREKSVETQWTDVTNIDLQIESKINKKFYDNNDIVFKNDAIRRQDEDSDDVEDVVWQDESDLKNEVDDTVSAKNIVDETKLNKHVTGNTACRNTETSFSDLTEDLSTELGFRIDEVNVEILQYKVNMLAEENQPVHIEAEACDVGSLGLDEHNTFVEAKSEYVLRDSGIGDEYTSQSEPSDSDDFLSSDTDGNRENVFGSSYQENNSVFASKLNSEQNPPYYLINKDDGLPSDDQLEYSESLPASNEESSPESVELPVNHKGDLCQSDMAAVLKQISALFSNVIEKENNKNNEVPHEKEPQPENDTASKFTFNDASEISSAQLLQRVSGVFGDSFGKWEEETHDECHSSTKEDNSQIEPEGKAKKDGRLEAGDVVLRVNHVQCGGKEEASQLIQSAFKTLTLDIWKSGSRRSSSSAGIKRRASERHERPKVETTTENDSKQQSMKSGNSMSYVITRSALQSRHNKQDTGYSSSEESMGKGKGLSHYASVDTIHNPSNNYKQYKPFDGKCASSLQEEKDDLAGELKTGCLGSSSNSTSVLPGGGSDLAANVRSKYWEKIQQFDESVEPILYGERMERHQASKSSSMPGRYSKPQANVATVQVIPQVEKQTAGKPEPSRFIPAESGREPDAHVNFTYEDIRELSFQTNFDHLNEVPPPPPIRDASSGWMQSPECSPRSTGSDDSKTVMQSDSSSKSDSLTTSEIMKSYSPVFAQTFSPPMSPSNLSSSEKLKIKLDSAKNSEFSPEASINKLTGKPMTPGTYFVAKPAFVTKSLNIKDVEKLPVSHNFDFAAENLNTEEVLNSAYIPSYDSNGHKFGDKDYDVPSPPERDITSRKKFPNIPGKLVDDVRPFMTEKEQYENIWDLRKAAQKQFAHNERGTPATFSSTNAQKPEEPTITAKHEYTASQSPMLLGLEREKHELSIQYKQKELEQQKQLESEHCKKKSERRSLDSSYIEYSAKDKKARRCSDQASLSHSYSSSHFGSGLEQILENTGLRHNRRQGSDPVRDTDEYHPKDEAEIPKKFIYVSDKVRERSSSEEIGRHVSEFMSVHTRANSNPDCQHLRLLSTELKTPFYQEAKIYKLAEPRLEVKHKVSDSGISDMDSTHERDNSDPEKLNDSKMTYIDADKKSELKAIQHNAVASWHAEKTGKILPKRINAGVQSPMGLYGDLSSDPRLKSPSGVSAWEVTRTRLSSSDRSDAAISPKQKSPSFTNGSLHYVDQEDEKRKFFPAHADYHGHLDSDAKVGIANRREYAVSVKTASSNPSYIQQYNKPGSYKLPKSQEYSTSNAFQPHSQRIEFRKLSDFPRIGEDQQPEHERAFVPIADHARSPSDASSIAETIHSEDTIEVECYNHRYSTCSSPELPLPPLPVTERMEDLDDEPLPPPPPPAELDIQHRPMSPIHMAQQIYHKTSYLSSKSTSRAGFYGNYHRSGICSPPVIESPTSDQPPPCLRKSKTKITKVGKAGATVIFSSDTLERPTHVNIANNEEIEHTSVSAQIANFEKVAGKPPISNGTARSESCYYPSYSRSRSSGTLPDIRDYGRSYRRARSDKIPDVVVSDESGQSTGTDSPRSVSSPPPIETRMYASRSTPSIHDLDRTSPTMQTSKIKPEIKLKLYTNRRVENDLTKSPTENGYLSPPICDSDGRLCLLRSRSESPVPRSPSPSQHIEDERHLQELTDQVASSTQDRRLSSLLRRDPRHKTMSDYITGLFDTDVQPRDRDIKPGKLKTKSKSFSAGEKKLSPTSQPSMSVLSAYLSTSEPKAKLMTRINSERHLQEADKTIDSTELVKKKEELINSISNKLKILREEQEAIKAEITANEELGAEVTKCVEKVAKPSEFEKYKMYVDELEKIMNLLLGLSGRLARAENALSNLPDDADMEERVALLEKRDKLSSQYEDALKLKEAIDRRSRTVSEFLQQYLTHDEYEDYEHFVKIKSKMIFDTREVDDKLKLGEEQLAALINSR